MVGSSFEEGDQINRVCCFRREGEKSEEEGGRGREKEGGCKIMECIINAVWSFSEGRKV